MPTKIRCEFIYLLALETLAVAKTYHEKFGKFDVSREFLASLKPKL